MSDDAGRPRCPSASTSTRGCRTAPSAITSVKRLCEADPPISFAVTSATSRFSSSSARLEDGARWPCEIGVLPFRGRAATQVQSAIHPVAAAEVSSRPPSRSSPLVASFAALIRHDCLTS
jgi:hypothetical protein